MIRLMPACALQQRGAQFDDRALAMRIVRFARDGCVRQHIHGAANARVRCVNRHGIIDFADGVQFIHGRAEGEIVFLARLFEDFDVRAVARAQRNRAVQHQLHIAGAAGLRARGRNLFGYIGGGNDLFRIAAIVIVAEYHAHAIVYRVIRIDDRRDAVDQQDYRLRAGVAGRALRAEDKCRGREIGDAALLHAAVEIPDRKRVQQLALVFVQALYLHRKDEVLRNDHAFALQNFRRQLALLFALYLNEPPRQIIIDMFAQRG